MFLRPRNRFELGALARPSSDKPKAKLSVMSMIDRILSGFGVPPAPPTETEVQHSRFARSTVAERSHGNIYLQLGDYYTRSDLDKQVAEVKGFDFTPDVKLSRERT